MAGTKDTPRQKMIGMMYLVLTALLALQVSSALIYKFQSLNESLESAVRENSGWNSAKLSKISDEVKKRGSRPNEVKLVSSAKEVSTKCKDLISYVDKIKKELIIESGGYDEDGNMKGAKEETKVEVIMIGANKNGKAYELKKKLDDFVKYMNKNSATKFAPMALDGKDDPLFKNNEEQRNKDFAELNFGQTPLVASLAILSEIQNRVSTMEATTLTALAEKVGMSDFKFDVLTPMVSPTSRVVAAGTKYEAQIFMSATSSTLKPEMLVGDKTLEVDGNGVGKYSFTASGGNYDQGIAKKTWTGKIKMKKPDGGDSVYTITEEYLVAQPVIQVTADAITALYRNCGNKLNIQVPALGNAYNPKITGEGAIVIPDSRKGFVTVVPTGANVSLKVSSDGNYIGDQKYKVRLIPNPKLEVKVNNRRVEPLGVDGLTLRNINVKPIADNEFAKNLPGDAYYQIVEWKLTHARGRNAVGAPKTYTTETVNVSTIAQEARQGDKLIIEIKKVRRKNFKGEWEESPIDGGIQIVPIN